MSDPWLAHLFECKRKPSQAYFKCRSGKSLEAQLAYLGSLCSGVVVCRSSPSQKAAIVRIMREFELRKLEEGPGGPLLQFFRRKNGAIKV